MDKQQWDCEACGQQQRRNGLNSDGTCFDVLACRDRLRAQLAARDARIAELESGLLDYWQQHGAVVSKGVEVAKRIRAEGFRRGIEMVAHELVEQSKAFLEAAAKTKCDDLAETWESSANYTRQLAAQIRALIDDGAA